MGTLKSHLLILLFWVLSAAVSGQSPETIGQVLLTRGTVTAVDMNGNSRNLTRRSEIFTADRIISGAAGFAQIRMVDSAVFALKENTEFTFHEYFYDGQGGLPDKARLELHKGGMRTIDGLIGDEDSNEYLLITPDVDVVPEGTTYECVIDNGKTVCGVNDGSIRLSNQAGSVLLGLGGNWDYAEAQDRQSAITPLMSMPPVLGNTVVQQNPNATARAQPPANSITPLSNGISFPAPTPIRVVPYRKPSP